MPVARLETERVPLARERLAVAACAGRGGAFFVVLNAKSPALDAGLFVCFVLRRLFGVIVRPGSDLLSQALRLSTIGAEGFNGRVRDGIGFWAPRNNHQVDEKHAGVNSGFVIFDLGADRSF